jgi:hypothetical protein
MVVSNSQVVVGGLQLCMGGGRRRQCSARCITMQNRATGAKKAGADIQRLWPLEGCNGLGLEW